MHKKYLKPRFCCYPTIVNVIFLGASLYRLTRAGSSPWSFHGFLLHYRAPNTAKQFESNDNKFVLTGSKINSQPVGPVMASRQRKTSTAVFKEQTSRDKEN